jgi:hypothetical protein
MDHKLAAGDRVRVANNFFWAQGATGTISPPPDAVTAISGTWDESLTRQENSALGTNTVYWSGSMSRSTMRTEMVRTEVALSGQAP